MGIPMMLAIVANLVVMSLPPAAASVGDSSAIQRTCARECHSANCSTAERLFAFDSSQSNAEHLLRWSCMDDCKYKCMWKTVDEFHKKGMETPQFHGKWPFIRILGVQEPASALFSIFNFLPHIFLLYKFRSEVQTGTRMCNVWTMYGVISLNTWVWSTVFHTRDFSFTEKMDYFCAFSIVTYSLLAFLLRLVGGDPVRSVFSTACCVAIFAHHIYNMAFVHFDYGYNMMVNIGVGAVNSVCWVTWAVYYWRTQPHVKTAFAAVLLLNVTVLLELLDFPPIFWTFDSHSLWHLSTAPIHFLWYKFATEDCKFLETQSKLHKGSGDRRNSRQKMA